MPHIYTLPGPNPSQVRQLELLFGPFDGEEVTLFDDNAVVGLINDRLGPDIADIVFGWKNRLDWEKDLDDQSEDNFYIEIEMYQNICRTVSDRLNSLKTDIEERTRFTAKAKKELLQIITSALTELDNADI